MAINFPDSPSVDQQFTVGDRTWRWSGAKWAVVSTFGPTGPTGPTGATGATGASGVIAVTGPLTNSGTSTSAVLGVAGGTAGQVLTSNGAGQATFETPASTAPTVHPMFIIGGI